MLELVPVDAPFGMLVDVTGTPLHHFYVMTRHDVIHLATRTTVWDALAAVLNNMIEHPGHVPQQWARHTPDSWSTKDLPF